MRLTAEELRQLRSVDHRRVIRRDMRHLLFRSRGRRVRGRRLRIRHRRQHIPFGIRVAGMLVDPNRRGRQRGFTLRIVRRACQGQPRSRTVIYGSRSACVGGQLSLRRTRIHRRRAMNPHVAGLNR